MSDQVFDTIIIGGSYAGLSAAMTLGRSLRNVLIIDGGEPCNAPTPYSHNFLTHDGSTPAEIAAIARKQVLKYPGIRMVDDLVTAAVKQGNQFSVTTRAGSTFISSTLLLATGVKDTLLPIPGLAACWGNSVLHCPYCHGYEVRGKKIGVMFHGEHTAEFTRMILNLSKDVVLLTNGAPELSSETIAFLSSANVPVISTPVTAIIHHDGQMQSITLQDGKSLALDAMFAKLSFTHSTNIAKDLGCAFTESNHIEVDPFFGSTSVEGVFAAGDCSTPQRTVSIAVAGGTKAGVGINRHLLFRN